MSDIVTLYIVKGTFIFLLGASALTWAIVALKAVQQWRLGRENRAFAKAFATFSGLAALKGQLATYSGPLARLARAGVDSWFESGDEAEDHVADLEVRRDLLERSLRQQVQRERRGVESGLPVLASVGSTAPFVGLFGTVLGIIHALQRIGSSGSASLDVVAGPIGEALVATAIGIAVAVPAVLAYNYFVRRLKAFSGDLEDFANTFVDSALRSSLSGGRAKAKHSSVRPIGLPLEASA